MNRHTTPDRIGGGLSCITCRWSMPLVEDDMQRMECRRYPPQIAADDGRLVRLFAQVDEEDWCGEHER